MSKADENKYMNVKLVIKYTDKKSFNDAIETMMDWNLESDGVLVMSYTGEKIIPKGE